MIDRFLRYLEFEKRYSNHTLVAYKNDLEQAASFIDKEFESTLLSANHAILRSWIVSLVEKGESATTVNRKIASLKSYYKFLMRREDVDKNPASRLKPLKTEKSLPSFVRESEITQLLDHITFGDDFTGIRDNLIMELLYATGIRLSELIELKAMDLDMHSRRIKVLGKRNKERIIPLHKELITLVKNYVASKNQLSHADPTVLIVTDEGNRLYPMFVYRTVRKYLGMVTTLTKKSPHVLRHTFATHLLDKGADLNAVKDLLGHTSLAATQVYTHNSMEKLKAAFNQAHPKA